MARALGAGFGGLFVPPWYLETSSDGVGKRERPA
jgi:hypothetical protein